jgi:hypothetical protein
MKEKGKMLKK